MATSCRTPARTITPVRRPACRKRGPKGGDHVVFFVHTLVALDQRDLAVIGRETTMSIASPGSRGVGSTDRCRRIEAMADDAYTFIWA